MIMCECDQSLYGTAEQVGPVKLLLLSFDNRKTMSRKSFEETYDSIRKGIDDHDHDNEDEEEMEFSMGKLIRQASLNSNSQTKHAAPKQVNASCSISGKKVVSRLETQTSLSSVERQEVQGFKKLGLEPKRGVISTLQEREKREDGGEKNRLRRTQSWAPPVPGRKKSTEEDIKTQIKFWARAVASNVRPE